MLFSLYQCVDGEWIGTHRLPFDIAVRTAKECRTRYGQPVYVLPNFYVGTTMQRRVQRHIEATNTVWIPA